MGSDGSKSPSSPDSAESCNENRDNMGSKNSSTSSQNIFGKVWSNKIRFNATPDAKRDHRKPIDPLNLYETIRDAKVSKISIYTSPLKRKMSVLAHQFLVIETDKGYFSLEKNDRGIEMQTHTDADVVTKRLGGQERNVGKCIHYFFNDISLWHLFLRFNIWEELFAGYDLIHRNCLHFVGKILMEAQKMDKEKKIGEAGLCIGERISNTFHLAKLALPN